MKNTLDTFLPRSLRAVTFIAVAWLLCPAVFAAGTNTVVTLPAFAPPVIGSTNQLAIGSPAIIVPPVIAKSLNLGAAGTADTDGAMAVEVIRTPLEHLLNDSGRFQIFEGASAGYKIQAGVAGFKIASDSAASTNKPSFFKGVTATFKGMFNKSTATNQLGGLDLVNGLNDINWSKDETRILIQCDVSIQLSRLNGQASELLAGKAGSVFKDMTVKDARAQMGAFDPVAGPTVQSKTDFEAWIIGLALHDALTNLMPEIDREISDPRAKVAQAAAAIARHHMAGKVVAVRAKELIVVSLGEVNDLKAGDKLSLFKTTDILNGAGAVMFTEEVPVGEITVKSVGQTNSIAAYPANVADVKEGWRVRAVQ
ncbi:MAG TPA: hypothetical protein VG347_16275 [Verrucomicrobiae bacterium]|nr:hypothetical protein [Verrucomicrobiae bacterium]